MKTVAVVCVVFTAAAPSAALDAGVQELRYDTGVQALQLCWYTGLNSWVGNDFDLATLKTSHNVLQEFRFYTSNSWPNGSFDGFRLAVFAMSGGAPGAMLWPEGGAGRFVKPTGAPGFKDFWVNYYLPAGQFLAAVEQYYNYPNCDPYYCDNNPTFLNRSWQRETGGPWERLAGLDPYPYRNLMLRVTVFLDYAEQDVAPTSLGRVKALYY